MSTNTSIYGTPEQWSPDHFSYTGSDRTKMFLIPYFGEGRQIQNIWFSQGSLKVGLIEGRLPRGAALSNGYLVEKQLDESLSYCGLGNESVYSRLTYFKPSATMFDNGFFAADNRAVTNFAFTERRGSGSSFGLQDRGTARHGSTSRYSPVGYMTEDTVGVGGNKNQQVTPFAQIPVKNCVLVPSLAVCSGFDETAGTCTNTRHVRLWDYLSDDYSFNKTSHPYILAIGFDIWYSESVDDIDEETGKPTVNRRITSGPSDALSRQFGNVAILSPLSVAKGMDADISNPGVGKLDDIYSYWFTMSDYANIGSNTNSAMLFGASPCGYGNGSQVGMMTTTNVSTNPNYGIIFPHENMVWRIAENNAGRGFCYLVYYDGLQEWIRRQLACFGLFFTDNEATALNGALNDENMFLGTLERGIGHGNYTRGENNRKQPQWKWETTNDSDYDPSNSLEIDNNIYGRSWGFNPVSLADSTVRRYVMSPAELENLGYSLWDIIDTTDADSLIQNQTLTNFLTNNPLDCLVSLKYFPFDDMSQAPLTNLVLGKVKVPNATGRPFGSDSIIRSCGVKHIYHRFNDWRDYICEYFLYLPFCGTLKLDAETVVGRDICVYYAIDYTTGTCTAYVTTWDDDGAECYIDSAPGNCSVDIPLSGVETATLTGELYNANENLKALKFNGIVGAVQGAFNMAGAAGSGSKLAAAGAGLQAGAGIVGAIHDKTVAEWNISHTQIPLKMIGSSSGCNSCQGELRPCVLIFYPETDDKFNRADYLHTVGAACCESGTIGDYKGYAEIVNADLSGLAATADEINMIRNQLSKGVYL